MRVVIAVLCGAVACVEPPANVGASCSRNSECAAPLVCALQVCRSECNSTRDCPIGSACVRSGGFGVCLLPDEASCADGACPTGLVCSQDRCTNACADGCVAGTTCVEDACVDPAGNAPCSTNVDCTIGVCLGGRCVAECVSDRDCRFGGFCASGRCGTTPPSDGGFDSSIDAVVDTAAPDVPGSVLCPGRTLDAVDVCTGFGYGCAVLSDGSAVCWGNNSGNQLGNPSIPSRADVRSAVDVFEVDDAVEIECGAAHTCVLRATGQLKCWGTNFVGELGVGISGPSLPPTDVPTLTAVTDFDLRQGGGCAVEGDQVWCWGSNDGGELGRPGGDVAQPVMATDLPPARQVEVFSGGGFVWTTDERLVAFGSRAGEVVTALPFTDVVQLEANRGRVGAVQEMHVCVRREGGEVWCAGQNSAGQLGATRDTPERFELAVEGIGPSVHVSVGSASTCSIDDESQAFCWGFNREGSLGLGTTLMNQPTPALVAGGVRAISASEFFGCGVIDGAVFCWGRNDEAQRGNSSGNEYEPTDPVECLP